LDQQSKHGRGAGNGSAHKGEVFPTNESLSEPRDPEGEKAKDIKGKAAVSLGKASRPKTKEGGKRATETFISKKARSGLISRREGGGKPGRSSRR